MKFLYTVAAPLGIGLITFLMAVAVSHRMGAGLAFGLVMGGVSGVLFSAALLYWSRHARRRW